MAEHLHETDYGQRWQVETVFSMIKRNLGETVNATNSWPPIPRDASARGHTQHHDSFKDEDVFDREHYQPKTDVDLATRMIARQ